MLSCFLDPRCVPFLVGIARDTSEVSRVRGDAIDALGYMQAAEALDDMIACLSDPSAEVRFWAAYALGEIRDRKALPALRRMARTDTAEIERWGSLAAEARAAIKSITTGHHCEI